MRSWIVVSLLVALVLGVAVVALVATEESESEPSSVDIYIGYTDIDGMRIPALGPDYTPHHTYVLAQDRKTRSGYVTRAGPERTCDDDDNLFDSRSRSRSGSVGTGSGSSCPLFCQPDEDWSGKEKLWAHSFSGVNECETETLHKQFVGTVNGPLSKVAAQMRRLATANNRCNNEVYRSGFPTAGIFCRTPYNSNSYAFSAVRELTGIRVKPEFGDRLSYGQCEFDRAHGWDQLVNLAGC